MDRLIHQMRRPIYRQSVRQAVCFLLLLAALFPKTASSSQGGRRVSSGYCTNNLCPFSSLRASSDAFNQVSATSFYLNASGAVLPCSATYGACAWNGSVEAFSGRVPGATGGAVQAVPLVFMNSGTTVANFRALVGDATAYDAAVATLAATALEEGFAGLSLDLEPSCWASEPSECAWPTADDAVDFKSFIDALSDALRSGSGKSATGSGAGAKEEKATTLAAIASRWVTLPTRTRWCGRVWRSHLGVSGRIDAATTARIVCGAHSSETEHFLSAADATSLWLPPSRRPLA